jgi:hypothetical protein
LFFGCDSGCIKFHLSSHVSFQLFKTRLQGLSMVTLYFIYDIQMSILDKAVKFEICLVPILWRRRKCEHWKSEANAIGKAVAVLRVWTKLNST